MAGSRGDPTEQLSLPGRVAWGKPHERGTRRGRIRRVASNAQTFALTDFASIDPALFGTQALRDGELDSVFHTPAQVVDGSS
jgi:hypothetical protein